MEEAYSQNENRTKKVPKSVKNFEKPDNILGITGYFQAAGKNKKEKILHQDYWKDFGDPFDQLNHSIKG